jgi:hypothetical protein
MSRCPSPTGNSRGTWCWDTSSRAGVDFQHVFQHFFRASVPASSEARLTDADKVRENRLRRAAERQGLRLRKSRARDPRAIGHGTYMLVDDRNNVVAYGLQSGYGLSLDEIEDHLSGGDSGVGP